MKLFLIVSIIVLLKVVKTTDEEAKGLKNIVLLGTTGSGKSTFGNLLLTGGPDLPFPVGHGSISETASSLAHENRKKGIRVIDTAGFGDHNVPEAEASKIFKQFIGTQLDKSKAGNASVSNPYIHAFVLVVRANPRIQTITKDLENIEQRLGKGALRSLVLVVMTDPKSQSTLDSTLAELRKMDLVIEMLNKAKGQVSNPNWLVLWNKPKATTEELEKELMLKIDNVHPYTIQDFKKVCSLQYKTAEEKINKLKEEELSKIDQDNSLDEATREVRRKQVENATKSKLHNLSIVTDCDGEWYEDFVSKYGKTVMKAGVGILTLGVKYYLFGGVSLKEVFTVASLLTLKQEL